MPVESIDTPLQAITYFTTNLILLIAVVSVLTYLFLKGYDLITKHHSPK